ncbi:hypothetical protein KY289_034431 [Solanum tuberosum]|nr:hypothetical protein KY289_034431 [Solanum tuberosum]
MKIINSVVVVGLYYGFLTTFSIGPSYLFLLRALVMEEGTEKKVSATTGRIPSPILTKKLKEASKTEERVESEEERDVEIETASEMKGTKQEQEGSTEEDPYPSPSLFSEEGWDPDKIDETEEIRVNGKDKIKDKFHFQFMIIRILI